MKRIKKQVDSLTKEKRAKETTLHRLSARANYLSDEALQEAQDVIAEKEAEIAAINEQIEALQETDEDEDENLRAALQELQDKVKEVEESLNGRTVQIRIGNFLKTKKSVREFMKTVRNSRDRAEFVQNWKACLVKNGVYQLPYPKTEEEEGGLEDFNLLIPQPVLDEITDMWGTEADNFLQLLDITGLKAYKTLVEVGKGPDSRAKGHRRGEPKTEQKLVFIQKEIRAQIIYKFIRLDRDMMEYEDEGGALMQYITRELSYRILHEIMRAVLVGDGRNGNGELEEEQHPDNSITKIEAVVDAGQPWVTEYKSSVLLGVAGSSENKGEETSGDVSVEGIAECLQLANLTPPTIDEVVNALSTIEAEGEVTLFLSKMAANSLRRFVYSADGTPIFLSMAELADRLGVARIITTHLLPHITYKQETDEKGGKIVSIIALVGKAYKLVGDLTIRGFEDFKLSFNKNEYLNEVYVGGALAVPHSAVFITQLCHPDKTEED